MERANFHMPEEERHKAMFTTKWDLSRPFCRCACNKGYFKPRFNGRANVMRVGDDVNGGPSAAELERRAKVEAKVAAKAKADELAKAREKELKKKEIAEAQQRNAQRKEERKEWKAAGGGAGGAGGSSSRGGGSRDLPKPTSLPAPRRNDMSRVDA